MHRFIFEFIERCAEKVNIPTTIIATGQPNITVPSPRIEVSFGQDTLTVTGRALGRQRTKQGEQITKESYRVSTEVIICIVHPPGEDLGKYVNPFIQELPKGLIDLKGNWVKVTVQKMNWVAKLPNYIKTNNLDYNLQTKIFQLTTNFVWSIAKKEVTPYLDQFYLIDK